MNYWKHSLLSKKKFGGEADDYLEVHKFLDSSKLFHYDMKHRVLLHHTYGIDLCLQKFGETLVNGNGQTIMIRDIAAEHCKEDLMGIVPTLNHWLTYVHPTVDSLITPLQIEDTKLKAFVLQPLLMTGLPCSLMITQSNFGVYLAKEILGLDYAVELANHIKVSPVHTMLQYVKLTERWQYTPDKTQLKQLADGNL